MSLFGLPSLRKLTSSMGSLRNPKRRSTRVHKPRRLQIDPLEERALLSVSPAGMNEILVNQHRNAISIGSDMYTDPVSLKDYPLFVARVGDPTTRPSDVNKNPVGNTQVIATSHDGDFVTVWQRTDEIRRLSLNPDGTVKLQNGQPVYDVMIDPKTGLATVDTNIYARYFTDEVQRIFLPDEVLNDADPTKYAKFSLVYGGNEVQKLSITAGWQPNTAFGPGFLGTAYQQNIVGQFTLGFDLDGSGSIGAGETTTVFFNESDFRADDFTMRPDHIMQTQLQSLGGALADVQVEAVDPHTYLFHFGNASAGQNQPQIRVMSSSFSSGFLPAVIASTVSEPVTLTSINVSPTDWSGTATAIQQAFVNSSANYLMAPWEFATPIQATFAAGPYTQPEVIRRPLADVEVTPVLGVPGHKDGTVFDITYVGASGKTDQPEVVISSIKDEQGTSLLSSAQLGVRTMKQPTSEFRVNPLEPYDPLLDRMKLTNQSNPAVAMDADGDFVVTWQSDVLNSDNPGSMTDIFARRFSPMAMVPDSEVQFFNHLNADGVLEPVQGVRPLGGEFRVNTTTVNQQVTPTVGMDFDGNFTIAWAQIGQNLSFFNGIFMQRYDRDGERVGGETRVNAETTSVHLNPYVAMSDDGHVGIAWESTDDPDYYVNAPYFTSVSAQIFDRAGNKLPNDLPLPGSGGDPSVCWDAGNHMSVSYEVIADADDVLAPSVGGYAEVFNVDGTVYRNTFRLNGGTVNGTTPNTNWSGDQWGFQIGTDADGDLVASYSGRGPEVADYFMIPGSMFANLINSQQNADLRPYFNPLTDILGGYTASDYSMVNPCDVEAALETVLLNAQNAGASLNQMGRLRALLDQVAGLMRGSAQGTQFTLWDAGPIGPLNVLTSDNVANNFRDGRDARYFIMMDRRDSGGSFVVNISPEFKSVAPGTLSLTLNPVYNNGVLDVPATRRAFESQLDAVLGRRWGTDPAGNRGTPAQGAEVRIIDPRTEGVQRENTLWDITPYLRYTVPPGGAASDLFDVIFEVTFTGEVHDTPLIMGLVSSGVTIGSVQDPPMVDEYAKGDPGTAQWYAGIGVQPDGSFVSAWTQFEGYTNDHNSYSPYGTLTNYANTNVYFRRFLESTDTAGPKVTDFLMPDGTRLTNGAQIDKPLQYITVTLDEEMMRAGPNAITDPRNWALTKDGVNVLGGIRKIYYGMNMAADLSNAGLGLSAVGSNKWEAVLVLDADGVNDTTGAAVPLTDGHYEVTALTSLRDKGGNALGRNGYTPNGTVFSRQFDILIPKTHESQVNDDAAGVQTTYDPNANPQTLPNSPQSVASDGNGNYVMVWKNDQPGQQGIWAKMYGVDWSKDEEGVRQSTISGPEYIMDPVKGAGYSVPAIRVTNDCTATYASVAKDLDGDFVVTWSQQDPVNPLDPTSPKTDWNVWARRYKANGDALGPAFQVNSYTRNVQKYSTVAMDSEGDFVITWQSLKQDGSGYGVYAQRYSPSGTTIGGTDEVQILTFQGKPKGTFQLSWDYDGDPSTPPIVTAPIIFSGNTFASADAIQTALQNAGITVSVQAISATEIAIRFIGTLGSKDQVQLQVINANLIGDVDAGVLVSTLADGTAGEFRVNDTTVGDQMHPSIAMAEDGSFVITWTGYGQSGDAPYQSNIYAKKFVSNKLIGGASSSTSTVTTIANTAFPGLNAHPMVVTVDDPANHIVSPGIGRDGVVEIDVNGVGGSWMGSGTLLISGLQILTAAHVVCNGAVPVAPGAISVVFNLPSGAVTIPASQVYVNPGWTGNVGTAGGDIAVITLSRPAPTGVDRYDIYRSGDEIGQIGQIYGYGLSGTGLTGDILPAGTKRTAENRLDTLGTPLGFTADYLMYDFDDGTAQHDAFGTLINLPDLGLGVREGMIAPGDSGGPTFLNGKIAGVHSFGATTTVPPGLDAVPGLNSSFGEIGGDTRVSVYAKWIDSIVQGGSGEILVNQTIADDQKWSSVAMDADGDFVVTWTSYGQDGGGTSYGRGVNGDYGVYARRFNNQAQPASGEFRVNTFTHGAQEMSRVSMDADGDFVIAWQSFQDRPAPSSSPDMPNSFGVYAQRYVRTSALGTNALFGPNGEYGSEFALNATKDGDQRYVSVAMNATGDFVATWSGPGPGDAQGVFYQRYEAMGDTAGPMVGDVLRAIDQPGNTASLRLVRDAAVLTSYDAAPSRFVLTFDEDLNTEGGVTGVNSVLNPNNWELTRNGIVIPRGVYSVHYGLSQAHVEWPGTASSPTSPSNKFEAVITLDADPTKSGMQPLGPGDYVLTLKDTVQDKFGNPLDGDFDGLPGGSFRRAFTITGSAAGTGPSGPGTPAPTDKDTAINLQVVGEQDEPAIAMNSNGDYVVVWTTQETILDPLTGISIPQATTDIMAQRFNRLGQKVGTQFVVNSHIAGSQSHPDVAMDPFGSFTVVWAGAGDTDDQGIFGRQFDANGAPLGPEFRVNVGVPGIQNEPAVAMDSTGNFVVTWSDFGQPGDGDCVMARQFTSTAVGGTPFRVNTNIVGVQNNSDVAVDAEGNFFVVWQSYRQDGSGWGVYGQRFAATGAPAGGEFRLNTYTNDNQMDPKVAMDAAGDAVVAWTSNGQEGPNYGYGIYARRYDRAGAAKESQEFHVNQYGAGHQWQPGVAMDSHGNFVVTWTTPGVPGSYPIGAPIDKEIYARMYNADGSDSLNKTTGLPMGEFRVNATTLGDQTDSAVAMDSDGDCAVVWVGPDDPNFVQNGPARNAGIFSRMIAVNAQVATPAPGGSVVGTGGYTVWDNAPAGPTARIITGTSGDDVFEITFGDTPDTWVVKLNGVVQVIEPTTTTLTFDGRGGTDTVRVITGNGNDKVEFRPNSVVLTGPSYTFTAANCENVDIKAQGGTNTVVFYDSEGDDTLVASPTSATFSSPGAFSYSFGPKDASTKFTYLKVQAYSTAGGNDTAKFYDSAGNDVFIANANPTGRGSYGQLTGTGFWLEANTFARVEAVSQNGGQDLARLYDSAGNDTFVAKPGQAILSNGTYANGQFTGQSYLFQATNFQTAQGFASSGTDTALFFDSPGKDSFDAYPTYSAMTYANGSYYKGTGFDMVEATSSAGDDIARLNGSTGVDHLHAAPDSATLNGNGFSQKVNGFRYVLANGGGGADTAELYDSAGDDTFFSQASQNVNLLYGSTFYTRALAFPTVEVFGTAGGQDMARLYDSTGSDVFTGYPTYAVLAASNNSYSTRVNNFGSVQAFSTAGGVDIAKFFGSAGNDTFTAYPTYASMLYSGGAYYKVNKFATVEATSTSGNGTAKLYDSAGDDTFNAYGANSAYNAGAAYAVLYGTGFSNKATGFKNVFGYSTAGGKDTANLYDSGRDDYFTYVAGSHYGGMSDGLTASTATFTYAATGFADLHAYASTGNDTARLYDTAMNELLEAESDWARLSSADLAFVATVHKFEKVTAMSSNAGDKKAVKSPLDFVLETPGSWTDQ